MVRIAPIGCLISLAAALLPVAVSGPSSAQSPPLSVSDQKALSDYSKQAKEYIDREHALESDKMKPTSDVGKLENQRKQLRDAVQQLRPNARQGDLFTPEVARILRELLAKLFHGPDGQRIRASLNHSEPGAPAQFKVNGDFPNQNGQPVQSVPATVLKILPVLPKGLEYTIAGKTLALRDTSANMVVDFLPNAVP